MVSTVMAALGLVNDAFEEFLHCFSSKAADVYENLILFHEPNGKRRIVSGQQIWRHGSRSRHNTIALERCQQLLSLKICRFLTAAAPKREGPDRKRVSLIDEVSAKTGKSEMRPRTQYHAAGAA